MEENKSLVKPEDKVPAIASAGAGVAKHLPEKHYSNLSISTLKLNKNESDSLLSKFDEAEIQIRPDGIIYLPEIFYRQRLNEVFGAGQWGIAKGNIAIKDNVVMYEGALFVRGNFIAEAIGEQEYFPNNPTMTYATAVEGAKSNCLMRCCKDLGINMDCWNPNFIQKWLEKYAIKVWRRNKSTNKVSVAWRKADAEPFYDETGIVKAEQKPVVEQSKTQPPPAGVETAQYEEVPKTKDSTKKQQNESSVADELKDLGVNIEGKEQTKPKAEESPDAVVFRAGEIITGLVTIKECEDYATDIRKNKDITPNQKLKIVDLCNKRKKAIIDEEKK